MRSNEDLTDFWADGNYAARMYEKAARVANTRVETFQQAQERERKERDRIAAYAWQAEASSLRIHKNFYTGDMDGFHEGPCCAGCIGEQEDGFSGGGMYCCCYEGKTPLEQWGNPVKYPPVNGKVPEIFEKWGPRTQERYLKRFKEELTDGERPSNIPA